MASSRACLRPKLGSGWNHVASVGRFFNSSRLSLLLPQTPPHLTWSEEPSGRLPERAVKVRPLVLRCRWWKRSHSIPNWLTEHFPPQTQSPVYGIADLLEYLQPRSAYRWHDVFHPRLPPSHPGKLARELSSKPASSSPLSLAVRPRTHAEKSLAAACWNAAGVRGKNLEMEECLSEHGVDIFLLNETNLELDRALSFANYVCQRTDRPTRGRGTEILVRRSIDQYAVPVSSLQQLEATAIHPVLATRTVKLVAAYLLTRPHHLWSSRHWPRA
jgi:hypothetical protein